MAGKSGLPKDFKDNKVSAKGQANNPKSNLDTWCNKLREEATRRLEIVTPTIFEIITQSYTSEKPDANGREGLHPYWSSDVERFLEGEEDGQMDHCLRWHILLKALKGRKGESKDAALAISDMIVKKWPNLAFVCLSREKGKEAKNDFYKKQCKDTNLHKVDDNATAFHIAAKNGDHTIIKTMISKAREIYCEAKGDKAADPPNIKGSLLELVQAPDPDTRSTALVLALNAQMTSVETLKELLEVPGITTSDKCFDRALEQGSYEAVEILLEKGQQLNASKTSRLIIDALDSFGRASEKGEEKSEEKSNKSYCQLEIVKSLVRRATTPEAFDQKVVEDIIKRNLVDVWKEKDDKVPSDDIKSRLLHIAVLHGKFDFVKIFLDAYPDSLSQTKTISGRGDQQDTGDKFPLWYNNHMWRDDLQKFEKKPKREPQKEQDASQRAKIRELVVTKMIHVLEMSQLSDILHRSHEPFDDLCFDISRMNSSMYQVSDFVDSLIYQDEDESRRMHRYEHTLKYVEFPPLDMMVADREGYRDNSYLKRGHDEVFRIFKWLSDRGVTKIIKLKVPDRLVNPHDALKMADWVKRFKVEELDWRVLDLYIPDFKNHEQEIKELHLYSSGKRSVISHWFKCDEGVRSLDKLERLWVHVVRETCTEMQAKELVKRLAKEKENLEEEKKGKVAVYDPNVVAWYPAPAVADLTKIAYRLAPKLAEWLVKLDGFGKGKPKHNRTKVAILDNGILSISPITPDAAASRGAMGEHMDDNTSAKITSDNTFSGDLRSDVPGSKFSSQTPYKTRKYDNGNSLWSRITAGRSFVESNSKFCPWQFPSDPHGTQMANLICAIDPLCEIYVARVAEDAFGITPKAVIKAIEWAISEEVDVISMSFVLGVDDKNLLKKLEEAEQAGIVMTCSLHDEGSRVINAYPASYKLESGSLIRLAACDEYGKLLREVEDKDYDYKLIGQDVPAGVVPFVKSEERITGSSVATALAAGLCSLILTCDRLAHPDKKYIMGNVKTVQKKYDESKRIGVVKKHLDNMRSSETTPFVVLEKFGNLSKPNVGEDVYNNGRLNSRAPSAAEVLKQAFGMVQQ